jgi:hypothetical protein
MNESVYALVGCNSHHEIREVFIGKQIQDCAYWSTRSPAIVLPVIEG